MGFTRKALFVGTGGLSGAAGIKANSKKERAARAAEQQLALERKTEEAERRRLAEERRREQIAKGAWWLEAGAFKGIASFRGTRYLGGLSGHEAIAKARILQLGPGALLFKGAFKTLISVRWDQVESVEIEDPHTSQRPVAQETMASDGGKKPEKWALLIARTINAGEALFLLRQMPEELAMKFAPMVQRLGEGRMRAGEAEGISLNAAPTAGIADELSKLAALRDSGVLSEAEFAAQKAKLLG